MSLSESVKDYIENKFNSYIEIQKITHINKDIIDKFLPFDDLYTHNFPEFYNNLINESVVKMNYIVQYTDTEIYINYIKDKNKYIKYLEYNLDDDYTEDNMSHNCLFSERLFLKCSIISTLNPLLFNNEEDYNKYMQFKNWNIIVYDYSNMNSKVSKSYSSIGIIYIDNDNKCIRFHSIKDSPFSLYSLVETNINNDFINKLSIIRENIITNFNRITKLNRKYCEIILFSLLTWSTSKQDNIINYFPLNIYQISNNKFESLVKFLKEILPSFQFFNFSIQDLNKKKIYPYYDEINEQFIPSNFQFIDGTMLIMNEIVKEGDVLNENGIFNFEFVKNIIENQIEYFYFPFNTNIEISINSSCIILSNERSIFSKSISSIIDIKLENDNDNDNENEKIKNDDLYDMMTYLIYSKRLLETNGIEINENLSNNLSSDYVEMRKKNKSIKVEDFKNLLTLSNLYVISNGRNNMNIEDYLTVKEILSIN